MIHHFKVIKIRNSKAMDSFKTSNICLLRLTKVKDSKPNIFVFLGDFLKSVNLKGFRKGDNFPIIEISPRVIN